MSGERLLVTLYTETQVFTGFIHQSREQRLLDFLNGASLSTPETSGTFLGLNDVAISHTNGQKEKLPTAYVNKATIQLAATSDGNSARGIGTKVGPKSYPFVPKSPAWVSLRMPAYALVGSMHVLQSWFKSWKYLIPVIVTQAMAMAMAMALAFPDTPRNCVA